MPPQPTLVTDVAIDASRRVAPPAAADQPGAPITAEEPEPPIAAEQLEAPDQDADERTMRPTEGVEMPPDEDTEMPPDKDTEMPTDGGDEMPLLLWRPRSRLDADDGQACRM